jgi:hypothetical protein
MNNTKLCKSECQTDLNLLSKYRSNGFMDEHIEHLLGSTVNIFNPVHIIKDLQVLTSFIGDVLSCHFLEDLVKLSNNFTSSLTEAECTLQINW